MTTDTTAPAAPATAGTADARDPAAAGGLRRRVTDVPYQAERWFRAHGKEAGIARELARARDWQGTR